MSFASAVRDGFANYANFAGRASRPAYWWWVVFLLIVDVAALFIDAALSPSGTRGSVVVFIAANIVLWLPGWAVMVRRLHDTDRTGWWSLLSVIPLGVFVVLIMLALPGTPGDNRYGPPRASRLLVGMP